MQTPRLFVLLAAAPLLVPAASGCMFLKAPPADPVPTPVPTPKAPFFDPAAGQPRGPGISTPLNKVGDPVFPDAFRVAGTTSGDRITIQSVDSVTVPAPAAATSSTSALSSRSSSSPSSSSSSGASGSSTSGSSTSGSSGSSTSGSSASGSSTSGASTSGSNSAAIATPAAPTLVLGTPDPVRLAGIVAPTTEPALGLARKTISDWTAGRDVDVEQDGKYPTDLRGVRVVQVFYKGRKGPYEGQVLSLNRMLVRSGNAVVDLYSPTAFDTSQWLLDEAYARRHRLGFWAFGTAIQQRIPLPLTVVKTGTGARSQVSIEPTTTTLPSATTSTTSTTTQTTSPSTSSPPSGSSSSSTSPPPSG